MDKSQVDECLRIINTISSMIDAEPFLAPVDFKELGLLDYPKVVRNPMDLSTLTSHCETGRYRNPREFFADLQLIWDNCKLYNKEDSHIYQRALNMERVAKVEKKASLVLKAKPVIKKEKDLTTVATNNSSGNNKSNVIFQQKNLNTNYCNTNPSYPPPPPPFVKKKIAKPSQKETSSTANSSQPQQTSKDKQSSASSSQQDKLAAGNPQERRFAHISMRLNLAFKLKNATEDKLVLLFATLAKKAPETLLQQSSDSNYTSTSLSPPLSLNLTTLPDHIVQIMLTVFE